MLKRLRLKFICINMLVVVLALLVMFGLVFQITSRDLERQSLVMMRAVATEPFRRGRPGELADGARIPYFVLQIGRDGSFVPIDGYFDLTDLDKLGELVSAARADGSQTGVLESYGFRFCFGRGPWGETLVFADMSSEVSTLHNLIRTFLIIGALSAAAFLVISIFLAKWAVRPVERAWGQQRQFVADASHELKTPLTVILTNAELLTSPTAGEEARRQYAGSILTVARQMRGLVLSLLELARVENGAPSAPSERVDLSSLLTDAALPFEPLYFEAGLTLESRLEPGIFTRGDGDRLRQVADILLDNALKYSEKPGTVLLELRRQGRRCLISVESPGEKLTRDELRDIFKRFYRADRARRMDGSYGLGLPIAQAIVREQGGRIWAENAPQGNVFRVELPLS